MSMTLTLRPPLPVVKPQTITAHGRERAVLLSAEAYKDFSGYPVKLLNPWSAAGG